MIIVDASTVRLTATFTESTKDVDNTVDPADNPPLTDLNHSTIYVKVGVAPPASVALIPATAKTGGGNISTTILVPALANAKTTFTAWVTETDDAGNEGPQSNVVTMTIDRVGPMAPINFTLA